MFSPEFEDAAWSFAKLLDLFSHLWGRVAGQVADDVAIMYMGSVVEKALLKKSLNIRNIPTQ